MNNKFYRISLVVIVLSAFVACSAFVKPVPTSLVGYVDSFQLENIDDNRVQLVLHSSENTITESDLESIYGISCQYVQDIGYVAILTRNSALGFLITLSDHDTRINVDEGKVTFRGLPIANAKDGSRDASVEVDQRKAFMR